ncbi:leucine-rich repeat-containing protein 74A-like isoform X2 [Siniperca chuatsi]|uniref:leucine-rich repeat-containing protein 74A-like isoform X2 n=1 Tax=Siniperca chuatsi TaxID=119488 RepID=UPI001CE1170C|nr:leucine-rich repeat-containing protein 74A-like isoform X2 [Siniperca chuatsi]
MDQWEEDCVDLQLNEEQQEEEQQPSDQSVLPTGSQDQMEDKEKPPQGKEGDSGDEWDTDLETDEATNQRQSFCRAELYLQACQRTGAVPVSSFLRNMGEANLNLNHYGVGPQGAKALAIVLQSDNDVTNLELEDNALQAEGTRYLMEMLQTNISIQSLNLSNNQLHLEGAVIISKMLLDNYYIKSIKLSGNYFDDSAAKYFADVLKGDYVVKELDLSHNKFCDTGGEHLGHMLATNVGIEVLNLSWNHLRMRGAVALSAGLKLNSTLKQLQLSWNGFGYIEAESLGQALKQNSTLVLLDLSSNRIDDQAVTLLCQGLATNDTLRVLKCVYFVQLSHNPLTNIGALTLLRTVKNNMKSALAEIDISTVFVCEAFLELLEEARQTRPALDVRYSVMISVTRNLSAIQIFQKFLEERNESIMDFFQALDKEGTMKVSTSAFRKAVKAANVPLDQQQLEWLIRKFDNNCTTTIIYSQFAELSQVQRRTAPPR